MATQEQVYNFLNKEEHKSIMILGGAGRGKSHLTRKFIAENPKVIVTATTGIAAVNVGGVTAASLFGLPIGLATREDKEKITRKSREAFSKSNTLLIEEIGQLRADQLQLIDYKLKILRSSSAPFGGVRVIGVGDFYQLGPILKKEEKPYYRYKGVFAFDAPVFNEVGFKTFELTQCYRQEKPEQVMILDSIRKKDRFSKFAVEAINDLATHVRKNDGRFFTLCTYKADVDRLNRENYSALPTKERVFHAIEDGVPFKDNELQVPRVLNLKVGAKVLISANDIGGSYFNGEMGRIVNFHTDSLLVEKEEDGSLVHIEPITWLKYDYELVDGELVKKVVGKFTQFPVQLGYACTINKAQGMTLDGMCLDLGRNTFAHGQFYMAISRPRDLAKVVLTREVRYSDLIVDERVSQFYAEVCNTFL